MDERIFVYFDAETSERPILMGTLFVARARGNEVSVSYTHLTLPTICSV